MNTAKMQDKFEGCLLGLAFGDAICAAYEGGFIERTLWRCIGKTKSGELRFTDDTQMTIDIAYSFLNEGLIKQDKLAKEFASSYQWSRGYGPGAAKILRKIRGGMPWEKASVSVYQTGSYGNGAAMRAPVIALCLPQTDDAAFQKAVLHCSEITHSHDLAIEGALLIAYATSHALADRATQEIYSHLIQSANTPVFQNKLSMCKDVLQRNVSLNIREIQQKLGNGMTAEQSCITAIYVALEYRDKPFIGLLNYIKKIGGDTDTIAAMAGAIWGAFNGAENLENECFSEELPRVEKQNQIRDYAIKLFQVNIEGLTILEGG